MTYTPQQALKAYEYIESLYQNTPIENGWWRGNVENLSECDTKARCEAFKLKLYAKIIP